MKTKEDRYLYDKQNKTRTTQGPTIAHLKLNSKNIERISVIYQSLTTLQIPYFTSLHDLDVNEKRAATRENRSSGFPTRSDTNRPVQSQKQARGLKF